MNLRSYLPSAQFSVIAVSLVLSGGLVVGASMLTRPPSAAQILADAAPIANGAGWEAELQDIQAQNASASLPTPPSPADVQNFLSAAKTSNVTASIGRTLLVNLANAKTQGLGNDIPTQEKLIEAAQAQLKAPAATAAYALSDLSLVDDSAAAMHSYGNSTISAVLEHPKANESDTLVAIGYATDNQDQRQLDKLPAIGAEYLALAKDLAATLVPRRVAPFHLQIVNNLVKISDTYRGMQALMQDPLRGLSALQLYQTTTDETGRVFINIAQELNKSDILFSKDEPGVAWNLLLPQQQL